MKLKALQDFSWAHRGCEVEEFKEGQVIETDDKDLIAVAVKEGWAEKSKGEKAKEPGENKAQQGSPENK